jgi:AcrR family transcriptional regulator
MVDDKAVRRDRKQELRAKLVAVARALIAEKGLGALSARKVADGAGVALGSLYTVFADLDALVFAVNLESFQTLDGVMAKAAAGADTAEAKLAGLVWAYLGFARAEPFLWRAMFEQPLPAGGTVPEENRDALVRLMMHIAEPLRVVSPMLNDEGRVQRARTLFAAFHGVIAMSLNQRQTGLQAGELEQELQALLDVMFRGV